MNRGGPVAVDRAASTDNSFSRIRGAVPSAAEAMQKIAPQKPQPFPRRPPVASLVLFVVAIVWFLHPFTHLHGAPEGLDSAHHGHSCQTDHPSPPAKGNDPAPSQHRGSALDHCETCLLTRGATPAPAMVPVALLLPPTLEVVYTQNPRITPRPTEFTRTRSPRGPPATLPRHHS